MTGPAPGWWTAQGAVEAAHQNTHTERIRWGRRQAATAHCGIIVDACGAKFCRLSSCWFSCLAKRKKNNHCDTFRQFYLVPSHLSWRRPKIMWCRRLISLHVRFKIQFEVLVISCSPMSPNIWMVSVVESDWQLPKYWSSVQIWGICTLHEYLYIFHYICWLITGPICKKVDFWVSFPTRQWYWCFGIIGRFGSRPKASAFDVFGTFLNIGAFPFHKATSSFINYLKKASWFSSVRNHPIETNEKVDVLILKGASFFQNWGRICTITFRSILRHQWITGFGSGKKLSEHS